MNDKTRREFKTALDRNLSREVRAQCIWADMSRAVDALLQRGIPAYVLQVEISSEAWLLLYQFNWIGPSWQVFPSRAWVCSYHEVCVCEELPHTFGFPEPDPPDFIIWQRL